jgi:ABC-type glycerol-3-phosphate transport system substrate-binding protein
MLTTKKFIPLAMSCAIVTAIAGCGGDPAPAKTAATPDKASTSAPATAPAASSKPNANEKMNLSPMTLKVTTRSGAIAPLVKDSPTLKEIAKKTNVTVDLQPVPDTGYDQKIQTLLATNNITDVTFLLAGNAQFSDAAKNNMFLPISDYMEHMPNFKKALEANPDINLNRVNGKLYGFPALGAWKLQLAQTPVIRADLLKKLNLSPPQSFTELYEVLKKFKEAYPDKIPYTNRLGAANIMPPLAFAMGSGYKIYFDPDVNGGSYLYGPAHAEFKPVLAYVNKLYSEKLLDPDYAVNTASTWQEKMSSGKALFFNDNNSFADNFNKALKGADPNAQFDLLPVLKNDKGQKRNYMYAKNWLSQYVISAKVKDPVSVVKFFDWMYSDEGTLVTNYGVEGEHYKMENGKPVITDSVLKKFATAADPFRYMQSELGTGYLTFAVNVDEHPLAATSSPELVKWGDQINEKNGYFTIPGLPPLNETEIEKVKTLRSKVDTIVDQEVDKFIMGASPLTEFDNFSKKLTDNGALEIEKIYNDAYLRFKKEYMK